MKTTTIKYQLIFKITGKHYRVFDTYDSAFDPDIKKYSKALSNSVYNEGVKLIKIETTRTEIDLPE